MEKLNSLGKGLPGFTPTILLLISLMGCTKTIDVSRFETLSQNEGVGYGRINVRVNGKDQSWGSRGIFQDAMRMSAGGTGEFRVFVWSEAANDFMLSMLTDDGTFFWKLPYGRYRILSYEWKWYEILVYKWLKGPIKAEFEISSACNICYLGTILLEVPKKKKAGLQQIRVLDEEAEATSRLRQISEGLPIQVEKHLMRVEEPL